MHLNRWYFILMPNIWIKSLKRKKTRQLSRYFQIPRCLAPCRQNVKILDQRSQLLHRCLAWRRQTLSELTDILAGKERGAYYMAWVKSVLKSSLCVWLTSSLFHQKRKGCMFLGTWTRSDGSLQPPSLGVSQPVVISFKSWPWGSALWRGFLCCLFGIIKKVLSAWWFY